MATDGRQVLVQGGFRFPWPDSVLIPASRLFACRELAPVVEFTVGVAGEWVFFDTGAWTVWLKRITDRKYPDVRSVIPATDTCPSRLNVAETDAAFLVDTLRSLPIDNEMNSPITLDLNGRALVRARPTTDTPVTQLNLSSSLLTGLPIRISTNRDYLLRALRLGFRQFAFQSPNTPVVCSEDLRHYVWAVLSPEDAIEAGDVAQELKAPADGPSALATTKNPNQQRSTVKPRQTRKAAATPTVAEPSTVESSIDTNSPGAVSKPTSDSASVEKPQAVAAKSGRTPKRSATLDHALHVRSLLRETLVQMDGLISTLRQQRKQSQLVRTTLKSLRQLERVAG